MTTLVEPLPRSARASWLRRIGRVRLDLLATGVLCLAAFLAIRGFWQPGVTSEADMLIGVYRLFELDQSWATHVFFPRVAMGLNFGYSGPLFQFYPPLASYTALAFHWLGLGWINAAKAGFTLALLLAGAGMYVYARWLFADRRAALVAGFAYLFAPYLLLNIYERGANAELLALGLLPWVFWTTHHLISSDDRVWFWVSAGLVALLMLAHNITALFVLPLLSLYLTLLAWRAGTWRRLPMLFLAIGLGLGLSAFYWLPAVAERSFTWLERNMLGPENLPYNSLRDLGDLFQRSLTFDFWGGRRFHPALWQAVALGAGILAIVLQPRGKRSRMVVIASLVIMLYFLQLSLARGLWEAAPLTHFIQFPWRLLGPASFLTALLLGSVFTWRRLAGPFGWILAILLAVGVSYASLHNLDPKHSSIWLPITDAQIGRHDLYARGAKGYPLYGDYTPAAMRDAPWELVRPRAADAAVTPPLAAEPLIQVISEDGRCLALRVETATPVSLRLPRIYFPGWRASVGGQAASITASDPLGLITVDIPAGNHPVQVCLGDTLLRKLASIVSLFALLVLVIGGARTKPFNRIVLAGAVSLLVMAVLAIAHQGLVSARREPVSLRAQLEDQITLLGYHIEENVLQPGDRLDLRLYWLTQRTPDADYKVFVHLSKVDDSGTVAQVDEPPVLGQGFTTRWDPGEIVVDEHQILIDDAIQPGTYQVLVGMYRPDIVRNLRVTGATDVWPGDRVALSQVTIRGK